MDVNVSEDVDFEENELEDDDDWGEIDTTIIDDFNGDEYLNAWQIELENKFYSAQNLMKNNRKKSIIEFEQCIDIEKKNSKIIDKQFHSMKYILLLKYENLLAMKSEENKNEIENEIHFEERFHQFLILSTIKNTSTNEHISNNELNDALHFIFNRMKNEFDIHSVMKYATLTSKYFSLLDSNEYSFTVKLCDKYLSDIKNTFDLKYVRNISHCNIFDIYNAVNDRLHKIIIDCRPEISEKAMAMNDAIFIPITKEWFISSLSTNEEEIKDSQMSNISLLEKEDHIWQMFGERVKFFDSNSMNAIYIYSNENCFAGLQSFAESLQYFLWTKIKKIIPFFIYEHGYHMFYKSYSFCCRLRNEMINGSFMCLMDDDHGRMQYPNQILNGELFLGNKRQAFNVDIIRNLKITHVINCTRDVNYFSVGNKDNIYKLRLKYLQLPVNDTPYSRIDEYFQKSYNFIERALSVNRICGVVEHRVLVHCSAGVSRSSTVVIAYLMKKKGMSFEQGLEFVKERRSSVCPNEGFIQQLKKYEQCQ